MSKVLNEQEMADVRTNKSIRGYILRCLAKCQNNSTMVSAIVSALSQSNLIMSPDISKYLNYLEDAGYIEYTDKKHKTYSIYANSKTIRLTKKGVDLVEGTIEDAGVDV